MYLEILKLSLHKVRMDDKKNNCKSIIVCVFSNAEMLHFWCLGSALPQIKAAV